MRNAGLILGLCLTGLLAAMALVSFFWTPFPVDEVRIAARFRPPGGANWLGTDHFGRDIVSLLMVGARNSIAVGAVVIGLGMLVGVPVGLAAAARGGWADEWLSRATDLVFAFPAILSAFLITALLGPGVVNAILAIGIFNMGVFARVTRGAAQAVWRREFVRAALALGRGPVAVTLVHVLPNVLGVLTVQATISFAAAILAEASLSYLGLGIQPPAPSWGKMLHDAQTFMLLRPSLAIIPGLAIALAVLGLNLLGDGLRDLLDPRLRRSR
ncbi:ABC transporter permease [Arenibaculum pallidiluteum]|uniref:ABC transporter permease n=1 Tax=Arenibaculum pallidiluteum TaxID=2812559 RepID=UPI001A95A7C0|nr:ABC transporter permease [Arenibaculum pallidiluteum]